MKVVLRDGVQIVGTLPSGASDNILTTDSTSVGSIPAIDSSNFLTTTLANGKIIVGNGSNLAVAVTPSGDATISNAGVIAITGGVIVNADINASAAIDASKIANGTVSSTEFQYLANVTSDIQTQLNAKANLAGPTFTGTTTVANLIDSGLTANTVPYANGSKQLTSSAVTPTELGYVSGVTGALQTQLNTKLPVTITSAANGDIIYRDSGTWINLARGSVGQVLTSTGGSIQWASGASNGLPAGGSAGQYLNKIDGTNYNAQWSTLTLNKVTDVTSTAAEVNILDGATLTVTELNYVDGVTSSIQTQIDGKLTNALSQNNIWYGNASNTPVPLAQGANGYVLTSSSGVPTWAPSASIALTDGQGTTANGSAVDLGGTVSTNINISMAGGFGGLIFDFDGTEFGVGQGTFLDAGTVGISGIVSGDVGAGDYSIAYASGGAASIGMFVSAGGGQSVTFDFDSTTNTVTFVDLRTSKKGIEYASSGYVTGARSLTDQGYVLGAKTFTGAQTFPDDLLFINNPASTFHYIVSSSAIAANRTITLPLLAGNDTFVFEAFTQTLSNKTLTAPKIADLGFIADANGNELIIFDTVASAVNEITFANAATGTNPRFTASGGDTDVGIDFRAQGAGVYSFLAPTGVGNAQLRLYQNGGTNYTSFTVGSQSGAVSYTLPVAAPGVSGYGLIATTAGVMSWAPTIGDVSYTNSTNKTTIIERVLENALGATSKQSTVLASSEIANGEAATIVVTVAGKDASSNTGLGGQFIAIWTKSGGTLQLVGETGGTLTSDTGDVVTIASSDSAGAIVVTLSTAGGAGNFNASMFAHITINTV